RRVRHPVYTASLILDVPSEEGISAGLVLFMNERHHYFLAVQRSGGNARLYLECVNRGQAGRLAEKELPLPNGSIGLQADVQKAVCSFRYTLADDRWETLMDNADASLISFSVPDALFLGATVGPYARMDEAK
ncbi:MAG TPA: hypothetical protein PLE88_10920, partial [Anaerohalosphaeraceae bacterium]|nr:hypothetical protein [Anaerohalosphaeraceae bacterium]